MRSTRSQVTSTGLILLVSLAATVAVCTNHVVRAGDLPEYIIAQSPPAVPAGQGRGRPLSLADDRPTLDELCRRYSHLVLAESDGNKSRAAEVLGINRRTLYRYLEADGAAAREGETGVDLAHEGPAGDSDAPARD